MDKETIKWVSIIVICVVICAVGFWIYLNWDKEALQIGTPGATSTAEVEK